MKTEPNKKILSKQKLGEILKNRLTKTIQKSITK